MVSKREVSRSPASNVDPSVDAKKSQDVVLLSGHMAKDSVAATKNTATVLGETREDALITPPSLSGTITKTFDGSFNAFDAQRDHPITGCKDEKPMPLLRGEHEQTDSEKKVPVSVGSNAVSQGNFWCLPFYKFLRPSFRVFLHFWQLSG